MVGRLLGHYRVEAKLGEGGMGVVYRAHDEHLQRDVAIKVLAAGTLADQAARDRFRTEALSLSRLSHPNIATVHDFDTQEGVDFLVLEYLLGQSLSRTLAAGPLPEAEVVRVGTHVAEALAAAHAAGVIHRDLKPGNLMVLPDGHVKVLDFGLAKLRAPASEAAGPETTTGVVAGTLPYMAPEQLRGERVDGRTDLYALGVVLYEMTTGQVPYSETTALRLADAILHAECAPLSRLRPGMSPSLESVILKCLAREPARRYQSAAELLADLQRVVAPLRGVGPPRARRAWRVAVATGIAVLLVATAVVSLNVAGLRERWFGGGANVTRDSIAVLPLKNLSGDPEQDYFAAGVTEDIISHLATLRGLKVISRTSVEQYKDTTKSLKTIGHELGVGTVMEGSVRRTGNRVRVVLQVIDATTDAHLWAQTYDRELSDIFEVQSDIARQVAGALRASLSSETTASLDHKPTANVEAYDYFLRGSDYYSPSADERSIRLAIQLYERAVTLDPDFALAHARLAEAHARMWWYHWDRNKERLSQARTALERAATLQPHLPDVHRARGFYYYWGLMDFDRALREFEIARTGRPGDSWNVAGIGWIKRRQGRIEESLADQLLGMELDPRSANIAFNVGETLLLLRRPMEANPYFDRALDLLPNYGRAYVYKARLHLRFTGDLESARAALERAEKAGFAAEPLVAYQWVFAELAARNYQAAIARLEQAPGDALNEQFWFVPRVLVDAQIRALIKDPDTARRRYETARAMLERLVHADPEDSHFQSALGLTLAGLGLKTEAIRVGKRAVELMPVTKEAYRGTYRVEDLARIYAMVGEADLAIDQLEHLMSIPAEFGYGALKLDPAWDPLRTHPRFQRLLERAGK